MFVTPNEEFAPECRHGHGKMEKLLGPHTDMFALVNINMFGMVDGGNGMAIQVFRCPHCLSLEMYDIEQDEFDRKMRDIHGPR